MFYRYLKKETIEESTPYDVVMMYCNYDGNWRKKNVIYKKTCFFLWNE